MFLRASLLLCLASFSAFGFVLNDGEEQDRATIVSTNPESTYQLCTEERSTENLVRFISNQSHNEDGQFIPGTQHTIHEHCVLVAGAKGVVQIDDKTNVISDSGVTALKVSESPTKLVGGKTGLRLDSCTVIAPGDLILQGDRIQACLFVQTPGCVSFQPYQATGLQFYLKPFHHTFRSSTGLDMESDSLFVSVDLDFTKKRFMIQWQNAAHLRISSAHRKRNHDGGQEAGHEEAYPPNKVPRPDPEK